MKGVPDEPSFDQHEIVFCDIIVSFAVTKPVTFRKFSRKFGHFLDTTLHGLPADAEVLLLENRKAPYTLYKKNLKGAPVVSFDIMRNLYETFFEHFREFEKPNYDYEPWYKNHSWDYTKLRAGAPFVYLKQHPEMFKGFYVDMKCLKTSPVPFKSYNGNNIVDYVCLLEIDPKTDALDNTDSVISLVETRLLRFFDKSSVELILSGKQVFPVRFVFACVVDRKTVNSTDSTVFYKHIELEDKFVVDIEIWIDMVDLYLRVSEDGSYS